jgi:acetyltransferase-like isoleucine patch superfamily enzyme
MVRVGDGAHIGLGASVRQGITIGEGAVVGAGSVVIRDVPPDTIVAGTPAKALGKVRWSVFSRA